MLRYVIGAVTDCKSAYDHLNGVSIHAGLEDKRTSIDVIMIRESMKRIGGRLRWTPSSLMGADGLTKDSGEAADATRSMLRSGRIQLCDEDQMLAARAEEKN